MMEQRYHTALQRSLTGQYCSVRELFLRRGRRTFAGEKLGATVGGQLKTILNRRAQPGRHPLHRIGLGDDLVDVIAIDALERAHLEADPRRLDPCQDHWTQAFGAEVGLNCYSAWIKQDC
jgi:hypothetical protein